jgi:hypothetical protein
MSAGQGPAVVRVAIANPLMVFAARLDRAQKNFLERRGGTGSANSGSRWSKPKKFIFRGDHPDHSDHQELRVVFCPDQPGPG